MMTDAERLAHLEQQLQEAQRSAAALRAALLAALIDPPTWHSEPLHNRIERECWKQHHEDFKDCEEPACLFLKRVAGVLGWSVGINGVLAAGTEAP